MGQDFRRQLDQGVELDPGRSLAARALGRGELQGAHAALAGVAKPFDRVKALGRPALGREPGVDQRVSVFVGQGVGQHPRQAVEAARVEVREAMDLGAQGHHQRRRLDATGDEGGRIGEGGDVGAVFQGHGADASSPQTDLGDGRHCSSPQVQGLPAPAPSSGSGRARCRVLPWRSSRSIGLGGL